MFGVEGLQEGQIGPRLNMHLSVNVKGSGKGARFCCGEKGHFARDCPWLTKAAKAAQPVDTNTQLALPQQAMQLQKTRDSPHTRTGPQGFDRNNRNEDGPDASSTGNTKAGTNTPTGGTIPERNLTDQAGCSRLTATKAGTTTHF